MPPESVPSRSSFPWTRRMEQALAMLCAHPDTPGVVTSSASGVYDRQPFIHWRTAEALEKRGEVDLIGYGTEGAEIRLRRP